MPARLSRSSRSIGPYSTVWSTWKVKQERHTNLEQ
ncbi:hypothetical protein RSAG8_00121, partial [Rhizoctonia solani AG-8 WAC10335]